ncbi:MAG: polysaccharide deacetylase family protein [Thermoleophilia bacterium]
MRIRPAMARLLVALVAALGLAAPAAAAPTVVTISFDDGWVDQYQARDILNARGMRATFYVNARFTGLAGRMTTTQLRQLQADGHEIGGHSLTHMHLPAQSVDEQRRQICDDRASLLGQGFAVRSFAYPYGENDATTRSIVAACGYRSARTVDGIGSVACLSTCPAAEAVPPLDPMATRTPPGVRDTTTLADLQTLVTRAESRGGGWVQIFFHQLCDGCGIYGAKPSLLAAFADWLATRAASGTVVRTAGEVVGGTVAPPVLGPARTGNLLRNPSFEADADANGVPDCWVRTGYGVNTFTWSRMNGARTGLFAELLAISALTSGDRKLITTMDAPGGCAPWATPGHAYAIGEWYMSSAPVRFVLYARSGAGTWAFWAKSPYVPAATAWTPTTWVTPPLPADATAVSGGLALDRPGTLLVDDAVLTER